ncbi:MAG TPA: hypothetical protein VN716_16240, partial [Vicinamibacterales bacterium]|nr:hypothetical protein [Vicinamibacterales bacterium]
AEATLQSGVDAVGDDAHGCQSRDERGHRPRMAHLAVAVSPGRRLAGVSADVVALLLVVAGIPLAILAIGAPLAFLLKLLLMLVARF